MKTRVGDQLIAVITIVCFALCFSCEKKELLSSNKDSIKESIGRLRSYEEALSLAKRSTELLKDNSTKSLSCRDIEDWFVIEGATTKSGDGDTLVYVFNYADSSGFSIISANPSTIPILSVTEAGHLSLGESSGVPGFDSYLEWVLEELRGVVPDPEPFIDTLELYYYFEYDTVGTYVSPILGQTRWGQGGVYGAFCPNNICGCFATALGQIMKSFSRPLSFSALCDMSNVYSFGTIISPHWSYIHNHYINHSYTKPCSPYHNEISAFLRDIGEFASSDYRNDGTGTWTNNSQIVPTLQHYGFTSSALVSANTNTMITSLNSGYPVCMFSPGHFYVADGYKDYTVTRYKYERAIGESGYILTGSVITEDIHAMHINWGWDGNCNGYFAFETYNTANAVEYDTNNHNVSQNYTNGAQMVYNIHPIN